MGSWRGDEGGVKEQSVSRGEAREQGEWGRKRIKKSRREKIKDPAVRKLVKTW